jgi:type IV pilus assembly protein PilM
MLFSFSSNKSYIGIDIGNSGIKVVELTAQGKRPRLRTYGYVETTLNLIKPPNPEEEERKTAAVLQKVLDEAHVASKKELAQAISWEAKKFVPMPINEMVLDWRQLEQQEKRKHKLFGIDKEDNKNDSTEKESNNNGDKATLIPDSKTVLGKQEDASEPGKQKVLVTAAPKVLVDRHIKLYQESELELVALETEGFALERSLIGRDPSVIMVVDLGSFSTDIAIIEDGIPILTRSVDIGGETITQALAKSLNVNESRAEQFKRDIGFTSSGVASVPKIIETTINPIINEIKYSFDLYLGQHKDASVEKIILTGGSSVLPGLVDYLKQILNINIFVGDPWARVIYPLELKPVLQELGPRFAVAIGLAMREIV